MRYHIEILISMILFALSFVWSKQALEFLTPEMLVLFRVAIALVMVSLFAFASGKIQKINRKDALWIALMALAEPVAYFLLEKNGIKILDSPTLACLIIGLMPIISPFFAFIINGERVSKWSWLGLFVGFSGVVAVAFSKGGDGLNWQITGMLLLFGSVIMAIIYTLMLQRISKRVNSYTIVSWLNLYSIIFLIPLVLFLDFEEITALTFSFDWVFPVMMLGVFCSSVAFILYANGVRELGVARTATYINLMPGITAVASFFLYGEELNTLKICGIALAIVGLFIANKAPKSSLSH